MVPWLTTFFQNTWSQSPRAMQVECFQVFSTNPISRGIINVTPAAGKTRLGVAIGKWKLETGRCRNIVVVSPTTEVRDSWQAEFARAGVQLASDFRKDAPLGSEYQGISTTYASVCATPEWYKLKFPASTLVIFDEIHHLEDKTGWGSSARTAFDRPTNDTIGLTGTLWRPRSTDSMSFVTYDENGYIKANFSYGYAPALADGIVRSVSFPTWDAESGRVKYIRGGKIKDGSFDFNPELSPSENERIWADTLRCACDPAFPFLRSMVKAAHEQLMSPLLRGGSDPTAGGIFFGESIEWLDFIQREVFKPLGIKSVVIHSGPECDDPKGEIKRSRDDHRIEWVLAAEMFTEGVSINRLRVGVHACCSVTELAFRQKLGRILRRPSADSKEAFYFMPRHPALIGFAKTIEREKRQAKEIEAKNDGGGGGGGGPSSLVALDAHGKQTDHIVGTSSIEDDYVAFSESVLRKAEMQFQLSPAGAAKLLSAAGVKMMASPRTTTAAPVAFVLEDAKTEKSKQISRLVRRAASIKLGPGDHPQSAKQEEIKRIQNDILSPLDGIYKDQRQACSLPQLEARYHRMVSYLKEITR